MHDDEQCENGTRLIEYKIHLKISNKQHQIEEWKSEAYNHKVLRFVVAVGATNKFLLTSE